MAMSETSPLLPTTLQPQLHISSLTSPSFNGNAPFWSNIAFSVAHSTVLVVRGPSGSGKSVLLKCLAQLLVYPEEAIILLNGATPTQVGIPKWRSRVLYLPQRPALLPGTPNEFFETVRSYRSRHGHYDMLDPKAVADEWGIGSHQWEQTWGSLSGGEAQRIALAIGYALNPEVLLLDEPTSALDAASTELVEKTLLSANANGQRQTCIWVTHSDEQAKRVADATFTIPECAPPLS